MVFACVAPVYAAALLPVVAFGSLAVIASVLVATGLVATGSADFDGLCSDIYDGLSAASKIGPKITLSVLAGVSYLHTSIVEMIAGEAVKHGAYAPVAKRMIEVNGYLYPAYPDGAAAVAGFVPIASFTHPPHFYDEPVLVEVEGPYFLQFSYDSFYASHRLYLVENGASVIFTQVFSCSDSVQIGSVVFIESSRNLFSLVKFSSKPVTFSPIGLTKPVIGSISVRFPWEVTDDLPSISSSGVLDKVNAGWLARERAIDGTASLPLSVPADTVAGAAAQTQTDAQAGTKTKDVAFDVVDDSAAGDFVDKGKLSFSLADFFPFCIPFDIIKGIKLLVAPVKAPVFDIPIKFPYIPEQTIHVDLSQYGGITVFSRWFLTLAFVIGLAAGTSKVMKW